MQGSVAVARLGLQLEGVDCLQCLGCFLDLGRQLDAAGLGIGLKFALCHFVHTPSLLLKAV